MIKSFIHYNDLNLKLFFRRTQINPSCATHNQFIHFIILYFLSILNFFSIHLKKKHLSFYKMSLPFLVNDKSVNYLRIEYKMTRESGYTFISSFFEISKFIKFNQ
jgi:hypothetical protein